MKTLLKIVDLILILFVGITLQGAIVVANIVRNIKIEYKSRRKAG